MSDKEPRRIDPRELAREPYLILSPDPVEVFNDMVNNLRAVDREETIFWCARLNLLRMYFKNPKDVAFDHLLAARFFTREEIRVMTRALKRIHKPRKNYLACFNRRSLLELIRWAALLGKDLAETESDLSLQEGHHLLLAARCAGHDAYRRLVEEHCESYLSHRLPDQTDFLPERDLPIFANMFSLNYSTRRDERLVGRSAVLLREELFWREPELLSHFERMCGFTLDAYLGCVLTARRLATGDLAPDPRSHIRRFGIIKPSGADPIGAKTRQIMERYLAVESQSIDELRTGLLARLPSKTVGETTPFDTTPLRLRPHIRGSNGEVILSDQNFLDDKLWLGPVFHLLADGTNAKSLFGKFGNAMERYVHRLIDSIVERAGRGCYHGVFFSPLANGGRAEITDICLRCGETLLMFECKSAWLPEAAQWTHGMGTYKAAIKERFASFDESVKGVGQLARSVIGLADCTVVPDNPELLAGVDTIVPIILVQDQISAPTHPRFLADEFESFVRAAWPRELRKENGWLKIGVYRVARPTMVTLSDLEAIESMFCRSSISDLILNYHEKDPERDLALSWLLEAVIQTLPHSKFDPTSMLAEKREEMKRAAAEEIGMRQ